MKSTLAICALCFALFSLGCRRSVQVNVNNSNSSGVSTDGAPIDRVQLQALLDKGKELYRSDQDSEAVDVFRQAVKLDPNMPEAHFRLGLAYEALNKQDEAEAEYKKAIETYKKHLTENPEDAEAHYNLGQTYAGLHEYSEAVKEYRQATKLKSDDTDIYYDLGTALTKLAQYDEAVAAFSKSLEIDPDNYRAEDALEEAREGVQRVRAGKKHQEDLLKKQKQDELKKAGSESSPPLPHSNSTPGF